MTPLGHLFEYPSSISEAYPLDNVRFCHTDIMVGEYSIPVSVSLSLKIIFAGLSNFQILQVKKNLEI